MQAGIRDRFELLLGGDSLPEKKPSPLQLKTAAESLGVAPHAATLVGDSHQDLRAARAAGYGFVLAAYGYGKIDETELGSARASAASPSCRGTRRRLGGGLRLVRLRGGAGGLRTRTSRRLTSRTSQSFSSVEKRIARALPVLSTERFCAVIPRVLRARSINDTYRRSSSCSGACRPNPRPRALRPAPRSTCSRDRSCLHGTRTRRSRSRAGCRDRTRPSRAACRSPGR